MGCNASMVFKANGAASFPESLRIHTLEVSLSLMVTSAPLWLLPITVSISKSPKRGLQARNAFERILSQHPTNLRVMIELNEVHILLQLIKQSELVTVLSEATIYNKQGVKAIPIDVPDNDMVGCVHMLKDVYRKHSAQEFIKLLSESNAIKKYMQAWL